MRLCEIKDCERNLYASRLCKLHYQRKYRGQQLDMITIYTDRKILIEKDIARVPLWGIGEVLVDVQDVGKVKMHKWSLDLGYAKTNINKKTVRMHTIILGVKSYGIKEIDHINRNKLDNRRSNLRLVSRKVNARNKGLYSHNTSGYTGVVNVKGKWVAQIKVDGRNIRLGTYSKKTDAILSRKKAETMYWLSVV